MKRSLLIASLLSLNLALSWAVQAHEEHGHEEASSRTGPSKAITEISEGNGIKLSEKAKKRLALAYFLLSGAVPYRVPTQSLVYSRDRIGVYRLRDGWFKFVEIRKISNQESIVLIESADLITGDQIVTQGVGLIRVADLDAFSEKSGDEH